MRIQHLFLSALLSTALVACIASCDSKQSSTQVKGQVIDATMNNIMLVTEKGDTLNISTMDADPQKVPGVMLEDKIEVTCVTEKVNNNDVLKAIKLKVTEPGKYRNADK